MPMILVNDLNMYYEVHGAGEPLVLIQGLSADLSAYQRLIDALAQHYQVIAFDNRGAGRTDKPDAPYSIGMMADDAAGLLTALGIQRASVLGISMGGRIAVELTLRHPELVRRLILVSTFVKRIRFPPRGPMYTLAVRFPLLRRVGKRYPQPQYAFERQRQASRDYDASGRVGEIRVPTLIMHGRSDRTAPLEAAEEMHGGIAGSRMMVFDGGHIFFMLRQQAFVEAVVGFMGETAGAK
jgi:3-oxoadipate enol-lactonase